MDSASALVTVPAPRAPLYRLGRSPDPFDPPSWAYVQADGTFGNRFDDPSGQRGVPPDRRFRVLYLATESAGAFGETLAGYRPDLAALVQAGAPPSTSRLARPVVPTAWRLTRRIGTTVLHRSLVFVDLAAPETVQALRSVLAPVAVALRLRDVDVSALSSPQRLLTQEAARYIYEQRDPAGVPRYAGIRYLSRLNVAWECWAVFTDRLRHTVVRVDLIPANHPGLYDAARILQLAIEDSSGRHLVP